MNTSQVNTTFKSINRVEHCLEIIDTHHYVHKIFNPQTVMYIIHDHKCLTIPEIPDEIYLLVRVSLMVTMVKMSVKIKCTESSAS